MPIECPKLRPKALCWCGLVVLAGIMLGSLAYGGLQPSLCVRTASKKMVFFSPLPAGQDFCIRFIHSVAKSPVEEWFQVRNKKIVLERTVYQDFGAGLPHEASAGQSMEFGDGVVSIHGYNTHIPELTVRVGRVAEHSLLLEQDAQQPARNSRQTSAYTVLPSAPRSHYDDATAGQPALFTTSRTEGKVFMAVPLRDMAPAGAALTFSVEACFWKYCAPWP